MALGSPPPESSSLDGMQPTYTAEAETFREKIQTFLAEHLPANWTGIGALDAEAAHQFTEEWRNILRDNKLLAASWPTEYGGAGLTELESVIMTEEFQKAGVPTGGPNDVFGIQMVGNTIIQWGTEEQKRHFLPRIISGEDRWCQGYSEPNAGSDLGNLGCRAVLDGDEWVINGQKIWTSAGHLADWIFVLGRTDPDAPKHRGITFLLVPMEQPGVEVRPIKMITGESEFNEVFFTDARCPKENVVGEVNGGWAVAMTLLGYERGEAAATTPVAFKGEIDRLLALAKERGRADDPLIRQHLAWCYSKVEIMRFLGMRTLTKFLSGEHPGPDASIFKLYWSEYHRTVTELAVDILGADALVVSGKLPSSAFSTDSAGAPNESGSWIGTFLNARAGTIYAGTSQVQRNIIGEMVLGLPKEPRADAGAWRDIPK
jgi:alkylation response protein AidB-like acyl-CoA dehydrogenase